MIKIKDRIIGLKELRENTERYIAEVQKGKSFIVMRKSQPVFTITATDNWGDDGMWDTVVDFTDIQSGGVKIHDVLKSFNKLRKLA